MAISKAVLLSLPTALVGSSKGFGDPSNITAKGVFKGIQAACKFKFGKSTSGVRVAVQGLGSVGSTLCELLYRDGATLSISDIDITKTKKISQMYNALVIDPTEVHRAEVDIFSPCALGGGLNDKTIPEIRAKIIAGAANNQLENITHGDMLKEKGILYAPDYVINAAGLIVVAHEHMNKTLDEAKDKVDGIYNTLLELFKRSETDNLSTAMVADNMAKEILENEKK